MTVKNFHLSNLVVSLNTVIMTCSNIDFCLHISQANELNDLVSKAFKANFARMSLKRDKKKGKKTPWTVSSDQPQQPNHLSPQSGGAAQVK